MVAFDKLVNFVVDSAEIVIEINNTYDLNNTALFQELVVVHLIQSIFFFFFINSCLDHYVRIGMRMIKESFSNK